jgi:hypothetical protein
MTKLWLAMSLGLATTQCGGITRPNAGDLCLVGQRIECDCAGRSKGVRTCTPEGIGYGECACGNSGTNDDGGGGLDVQTCTSKAGWTGGLQGSTAMTPGRACIECHSTTPSAPRYAIAGTIFPGLHDPDDCNGVDGLGFAVAFFSDSGAELGPRVQLNRVGNDFYTGPVPAQYRVKVIAQGVELVMQSPVTNGDCNFCHTASGKSGASGRLTKPPL